MMNYPIYGKQELQFSEQDGAYHISDFHNFITTLLERNILDHVVEEGVAKLVSINGTDTLSTKQKGVLNIILKNNINYSNCNRCQTEIPFSEILDANDNGGYCNYCYHVSQKED